MTRDHTDWRQVFLIFVIGLLAAGQFGKVSLNFDLLRETYARPDPELALIVSGVGVMGIVFGAVAGMGVARFGARRVLLWALGVAGALSLMQASLPSFWPLIGLRVIEGGAHLALVVASPVLVAGAAAPRDRPVAMALWASFFGVSFAVSAPIFAAIGSLPAIFATHGLALWLLWPLAMLWVTRAQPRSRAWPGFWGTHRAIYSSPHRIAPALVFFWHTLTFVALLTFLPEQLAGIVPQAVVAGLLPVTALVGIFAAGWLARYIMPLRLCLMSFGVTFAMTVFLPVLPDVAQVVWAALIFVSVGVVPGAAFATIPVLNDSPEDQAEANGAMAQLGNIGTTSGTPLYALALGLGGFGGLTSLTLALCGAGMLTVFWIGKRLG